MEILLFPFVVTITYICISCCNVVSLLFFFQVIDACAKGNLGRFINHSCEPNCRTEKVSLVIGFVLYLAENFWVSSLTCLMDQLVDAYQNWKLFFFNFQFLLLFVVSSFTSFDFI